MILNCAFVLLVGLSFAGAPYLESWSQENIYKMRQRNAREMSAHIVTDERWSFNEKLLKIALRKNVFAI